MFVVQRTARREKCWPKLRTYDLEREIGQIYTRITSHLKRSFRWLSYEYYSIYSIFIIFSIQFRSTNSIRSVHSASLMVIIFFSRVSRLPLDCVGYQWSKAKWSIFSFLFLFHSVLRNFLLYPPAPAALVNGALIPITYNLRRWIELIFFSSF